MSFGLMAINDMSMFTKKNLSELLNFKFISEFALTHVYIYIYLQIYCCVNQAKNNIYLDMQLYLDYFILHSIVFSPHNTFINLPKFSLVFFVHYLIPTSIIIKLLFLQDCHLAIPTLHF